MSFDGTYHCVIETPMGKQEATLTLEQSGDLLSGTMAAQGNSTPLQNGRVDGESATWSVDVTQPMPLTLNFNGTKSGDVISGTVELGAFGQSSFTATAT